MSLAHDIKIDTAIAGILCLFVIIGVVYVGFTKGDQADLTGSVALAIIAGSLIVGVSLVRSAQVLRGAK